MRQSIECSICLVLAIIDPKMVLRELLGSPNLLKAQALGIHKLAEIVILSKNKNLVFTIF